MCLTFYLNVFVNVIINTYMKDTNCLLLIIKNNSFDYNNIYPILKVVIGNSYKIKNLDRILHFGCQDIIIQVDNPVLIIDQFENEIKQQIQRFNYRRYLILPSGNNFNSNNVLSIQSLKYVPDVLLVESEETTKANNNSDKYFSQNCDQIFYLKTNKYVGLSGNDEIITLDKWFSTNFSFEFRRNLYPDKISDMQGRILKMATFNYKPYAIVGKTIDKTDGTEIRIALEYASKHNATVEFVVDDVSEWGEIYDNWTGNGILGNVAMDNADIGFGALYTWYHEFSFLDLSLPVVRTGITCLAPTPRLQSGLLVPFFPFNLILWVAVMVAFGVSVIFLGVIVYLTYLQVKRENNTDLHDTTDRFVIFLMTVRIFLLQSWPTIRSFDKPALRILLSCILICSLLIATCYSSGLASSMTIPRYERAIKTVQDLADSNIHWGATHEAWIFSIALATQPTIVKIRKNFKILTETQLHRRTRTRDYAFSIERLPFGHYAIGSYITSNIVQNLLLMKEDIYWEQCVFMTRKSSVFIPSLNQLILRIHESGLSYVWETQVALHYLDNQVQLAVKFLSQQDHNIDDEPIKLRFMHIEGALLIWFAGITIAFIGFLAEFIVHRYVGNNLIIH